MKQLQAAIGAMMIMVIIIGADDDIIFYFNFYILNSKYLNFYTVNLFLNSLMI